jgi:geranylgeranyl pyrophosphate synthase
VNVGTCLLFTHGAFLAGLDAPAETRAGWARAFAEGGRTLTAGQHVDLRAHPDADLDEEGVLRLGAEKAGAAIGAFASLAPIWAGRDDVPAWNALGVTIGQLFQLVSDLAPYAGFGPHADLAAAKLTLPLLVARDLDPGLSALWADGLPLAPDRQAELRRRVAASGAVGYARMRVEVLQREAASQLEALDVPSLASELAPVLQAADLGDEGPNI